MRADAGTGKTTVLVERFVRAVWRTRCRWSAILAITFTEKAAAELRARVRALPRARRARSAREAEGAWISTIHGFCARLLRAHALSAGIDPEFRVLDELEAERLALDAFDGRSRTSSARRRARAARAGRRVHADRLRDMVRTAYARLRSRGSAGRCSSGATRRSPAASAARSRRHPRRAAELGGPTARRSSKRAIAKLERCRDVLAAAPAGALAEPPPTSKGSRPGRAKALQGATCEEYRRRTRLRSLCVRATREYGDYVLLRVLLGLYGERYEEAKRARSALDFEDLELLARDLLAGDDGLREQLRRSASRTCWWTSSRTRTGSRTSCSSCSSATTCSASATSTSRSTVPPRRRGGLPPPRDEAEPRGRGERITRELPQPRRAARRGRRRLRARSGTSASSRCARRRRPREPPAASPAVELLVVDRHKQRWEGARRRGEPFGAALNGPRRGERPRRGCWPSGWTS